jgi:hypothetical protein
MKRKGFAKAEDSGTKYLRLVIEAETYDGPIWLGDDAGHLVQKAVGVLDTYLLPGSYVVEFTLGGPTGSTADAQRPR